MGRKRAPGGIIWLTAAASAGIVVLFVIALGLVRHAPTADERELAALFPVRELPPAQAAELARGKAVADELISEVLAGRADQLYAMRLWKGHGEWFEKKVRLLPFAVGGRLVNYDSSIYESGFTNMHHYVVETKDKRLFQVSIMASVDGEARVDSPPEVRELDLSEDPPTFKALEDAPSHNQAQSFRARPR